MKEFEYAMESSVVYCKTSYVLCTFFKTLDSISLPVHLFAYFFSPLLLLMMLLLLVFCSLDLLLLLISIIVI